MRYHVLVSDYDGTLAHEGRVDEPTVAALERLLASGRKLILVTGRELPELLYIFPELHFFARVVAENGALLYNPGTKEEKVLSTPPPPGFVEALRSRGVTPLAVGRVIVAAQDYQSLPFLAVTRRMRASAIWHATVRIHTSS